MRSSQSELGLAVIGAAIFCFSKLVSSTARLFRSVYFMYYSYSNATEKERHNTNPLPDGIFFVDRTSLGILRDESLRNFPCQHMYTSKFQI